MNRASPAPTTTQRLLDMVERVGNRVPHAALIFLTLIAIMVVVSHVLFLAGVSISHEVIVPEARAIEPAIPADAGVYDAEMNGDLSGRRCPEAAMAAYRLADSPSNMITRVMSAFALILTFFQKYDRNAGTGTLIALMLPYCVWILVMWTLLFSAWFVLGFPWGL